MPELSDMTLRVSELPSPPRLNLLTTALFLDLDGTLTGIRPTPGEVTAHPERSRLLERLQGWLGGRLAVLSGRSIDDVDRVLEGAVQCVAGVHGLERRDQYGLRVDFAPHAGLQVADAVLQALASAQAGLLLERKGAALALHYRGHPPSREACLDAAHRLAKAHGLIIREGKMVVELCTPGPSKGDALSTYMADRAFAGATPVMVGDDLTDESAFAAADAAGGFGVLVGEPRETGARYGLANPAAVRNWLWTSLA